nr:EOG090X0ACT [Macrothrix elegans]
MGCDGGTIPKRDELVKTKKKPEQKDKNAELHCKWRLCASSQEPLKPPVVACELGRLFNKESVLEILLDKPKAPDCGKHLRSLKDVRELQLTPNPAFTKQTTKGDAYDDLQIAEFICPVLGIEMNGKFKFCFIWSCGCVMSERALKEIKTSVCHKCQKTFKDEDVIILNPVDEELEQTKANMELRRSANKNKSKNSKRNGSTLETKEDKGKRLKVEPNNTSNIVQKLIKLEDPEMKKITSTYSVAKDPNASEVFKSLFTTSKKAKTQQKAHWITYNPFYN